MQIKKKENNLILCLLLSLEKTRNKEVKKAIIKDIKNSGLIQDVIRRKVENIQNRIALFFKTNEKEIPRIIKINAKRETNGQILYVTIRINVENIIDIQLFTFASLKNK